MYCWHIPARFKFIGRPYYFAWILLFPVAHNNWLAFNCFYLLRRFSLIFHTTNIEFVHFFALICDKTGQAKKKFLLVDLGQLQMPSSKNYNFLKISIRYNYDMPSQLLLCRRLYIKNIFVTNFRWLFCSKLLNKVATYSTFYGVCNTTSVF